MQSRIKVKFTDMWQSFSPFGYGLVRYLEEIFPIEYCKEPDYLFFSISDHDHLNYDCEKIFITHEAAYPDFRWCDYAVTFAPHIDTPRHLQLPNFAVTIGYRTMERLAVQHREVTRQLLSDKTMFAAYLASNGKAKVREEIVDKLSAYKNVACGGRHRNNIGRIIPPAENLDFLGSAKFVISCENSIAPGYVTEKIAFALLSNSIPIYWGDDFVNEIFNPERFINAAQFNSIDDLCEYIKEVDQNDDLYMRILSQPCFPANAVPTCLRKETLFDFFDGVFSGKYKNSDRPILRDEDYGDLKGKHRRVIRAPMSQIEADAFKVSRDDYFARRLLETEHSDVLTGIMRRLYDQRHPS